MCWWWHSILWSSGDTRHVLVKTGPGDVLMVMFYIVEFRCCVGEDRSRWCVDGDIIQCCWVQVTQELCWWRQVQGMHWWWRSVLWSSGDTGAVLVKTGPGDALMVTFCTVEFGWHRCCVGEDRSRGRIDGDVLYCGVRVTQVLCWWRQVQVMCWWWRSVLWSSGAVFLETGPGDVLMVMFCIVEFRCCVGEDWSRWCVDGNILYCGVQMTQELCYWRPVQVVCWSWWFIFLDETRTVSMKAGPGWVLTVTVSVVLFSNTRTMLVKAGPGGLLMVTLFRVVFR